MAGYSGYSMSNNAIAAYDDGEKPLAKWTKIEMLEEIERKIEEEETSLDFETIKKLHKEELKDIFLIYSSWHHTSKMYNRTEFFEISIDDVTNEKIQEAILERAEKPKPTKKEVIPFFYADVIFKEWEGSKKYGKFIEIESQAIIQGNNAFLLPYGNRKMVSGKYFKIKKQYTRKPKTFSKIQVEQIKKKCIKK